MIDQEAAPMTSERAFDQWAGPVLSNRAGDRDRAAFRAGWNAALAARPQQDANAEGSSDVSLSGGNENVGQQSNESTTALHRRAQTDSREGRDARDRVPDAQDDAGVAKGVAQNVAESWLHDRNGEVRRELYTQNDEEIDRLAREHADKPWIARPLEIHFEPGDLIFVSPEKWAITKGTNGWMTLVLYDRSAINGPFFLCKGPRGGGFIAPRMMEGWRRAARPAASLDVVLMCGLVVDAENALVAFDEWMLADSVGALGSSTLAELMDCLRGTLHQIRTQTDETAENSTRDRLRAILSVDPQIEAEDWHRELCAEPQTDERTERLRAVINSLIEFGDHLGYCNSVRGSVDGSGINGTCDCGRDQAVSDAQKFIEGELGT